MLKKLFHAGPHILVNKMVFIQKGKTNKTFWYLFGQNMTILRERHDAEKEIKCPNYQIKCKQNLEHGLGAQSCKMFSFSELLYSRYFLQDTE